MLPSILMNLDFAAGTAGGGGAAVSTGMRYRYGYRLHWQTALVLLGLALSRGF
jgi:hypothetical protein